jgi:hypothetical protein
VKDGRARAGGNTVEESAMKVKAFFRFERFRAWLKKLRDEYLNWKVRKAW